MQLFKNTQIGITDYTEIYLQQKTIGDDVVDDDDDDDDEHQLQTEQQANRHLVSPGAMYTIDI